MIDWGKHRVHPSLGPDGTEDGPAPSAPRRRHDSVTNFRPSPFEVGSADAETVAAEALERPAEPEFFPVVEPPHPGVRRAPAIEDRTVVRPMSETYPPDLARRSTVPPASGIVQGPRRVRRSEAPPSYGPPGYGEPPGRVAYSPPGVEAGRPSALTVPSTPRGGAPSRSGMRVPPLFRATPEPAPIQRLPVTFAGHAPRAVGLVGETRGGFRLRPTRAGVVALLAFAACFVAVVLALRVGVLRGLRAPVPPIVVAVPAGEPKAPEPVVPVPPAPTPVASAEAAPTASAKSSSSSRRKHRRAPVEQEEEEEEEVVAPPRRVGVGAAGAASAAVPVPVVADDPDATAEIQQLAKDQLENSLH